MGEDEKAINRLKYLSASLVLRRPKATISLPSRRDLQYAIDFSPEERDVYNKIRNRAIAKIEDALQSNSDSSKSVAYVNILQQIESMRLTCNLGLHYHSRHDGGNQIITDSWRSMAQSTFNAQREMEPMTCLCCSSSFSLAESLLDSADGKGEGQFFRCLKFCCGDCSKRTRQPKRELGCGHSPPCPGATVSLGGHAVEEIASLASLRPQASIELPSKVRALVTDIKSLPRDVKW